MLKHDRVSAMCLAVLGSGVDIWDLFDIVGIDIGNNRAEPISIGNFSLL